ncbi:MAG: hypothetical protein Q7S37_04695 [bacterium]|nr:hypothetical protein [bacterium]
MVQTVDNPVRVTKVDPLVHAVNALAKLFGAPSFPEENLAGLTLQGLYSKMLASQRRTRRHVSWCLSGTKGFYFIVKGHGGETVVRIHPGIKTGDVELNARLKNTKQTGLALEARWALDYGYVISAKTRDENSFDADSLDYQKNVLCDILGRISIMARALETDEPETQVIRRFIGAPAYKALQLAA